MPRKIYAKEIKAAFLSAAISARGQGKTWNEALAAAKEAGYTGSRQGIVKMIRSTREAKGKAAGRRRKRVGRPRGKRLGRPPGVRKAVVGGGHYEPIQTMIDQLVKERVRGVLDRAIAELQKARN